MNADVILAMISIRHILLFVAWIACLGAAYVATIELPANGTEIPAFTAWCVFIFVSLTLLALSFVGGEQNRKAIIGASVFSIGAIVLFYHADMNVGRTPGTLLTDSVLFTAEPYVAPYSYSGSFGNGMSEMNVNSEPTDDQLTDRDEWNSQRESVAYIIDLFAASCMALFGACLGAYMSRRTKTAGNQ